MTLPLAWSGPVLQSSLRPVTAPFSRAEASKPAASSAVSSAARSSVLCASAAVGVKLNRRQRRSARLGRRAVAEAETLVVPRPETADPLEKENEQLLERLAKQVEEINALEDQFDSLDTEGLRAKTKELRTRVQAKGTFDDQTVCEAFALLREAVWRVLELWYFDVQLLGGLVLHNERLAEMKTGEGKTIVALLPTFLAALEGKGGVFVVTPNDYLSRRDAENVGQVLRFLGVSVGLVQSTMEYEQRQKAYDCDVVYLTNAELGFDYLRDNLAVYKHQMVQSKPFHFVLVDEADSILIDEARTPLIISESIPAQQRQFVVAREVAEQLIKDVHYTVDEKLLNLVLTDPGEKYAQDLLGVKDMWSADEAWILYVLNALKAKELFKVNEQYIVRDGKVAIVDTFTGRVLEGRRWTDGIHQAIEAKAGITVSVRSQVSAQITYQALFRLFPRMCAMTGTAVTEAAEFDEIYGLRCTAIPTARPNVRRDYPDVVYRTDEAKLRALVQEITLNTERNLRPILIGTCNVKTSERIAELLRANNIECSLLNARPESVARESETIASAGRLGKVTVSTNMAGRGTDIILGGNFSQMAQLNLRQRLAAGLLTGKELEKVPDVDPNFYPCEIPEEIDANLQAAAEAVINSERGKNTTTFLGLEELVAQIAGEAPFEDGASLEELASLREAYGEIKALFKEVLLPEKEKVIRCGGLYVLGTSRHESRRIDNQLRGRAGRQGDPGTTRFFVSLEDDVFRVFGGDKIKDIMDSFRLGDEIPLQSPVVNDTLGKVQTAVEEFFKKTRTTLFSFDEVISKQRELTYKTRRKFLAADTDQVKAFLEEWGRESVRTYMDNVKDKDAEGTAKEFKDYFGWDMPSFPAGLKPKELEDQLYEDVLKNIRRKWTEYEEFRPGFAFEAANIATIVTIDDEWKLLLYKMDALKQTVQLAAFKGTDPLKEYQVQGFKLYEKVADRYKARSVSRWLRSKPKKDAK